MFTPVVSSVMESASVGQYVLVTKFSTANHLDPWYVGTILEIGEDNNGRFVKLREVGGKWRYMQPLTPEEGKQILEQWFSFGGYEIFKKNKPL